MEKYICLFFCVLCLSNCADTRSKYNNNRLREDLVSTINEYYSNWEKLDLGKMWDLLSSSIKMEYGDKEEFLKKWKNYKIRVKHYTIKEIQISNGNAKVKIEAIAMENGNEMSDVYFDYWKIENSKWVLDQSGRKEKE